MQHCRVAFNLRLPQIEFDSAEHLKKPPTRKILAPHALFHAAENCHLIQRARPRRTVRAPSAVFLRLDRSPHQHQPNADHRNRPQQRPRYAHQIKFAQLQQNPRRQQDHAPHPPAFIQNVYNPGQHQNHRPESPQSTDRNDSHVIQQQRHADKHDHAAPRESPAIRSQWLSLHYGLSSSACVLFAANFRACADSALRISPIPTAMTSNGQHNTSTFAATASSSPSFHTTNDTAFCAAAPSAAIHPNDAAPDPCQNSLSCVSNIQTSPKSTAAPTQSITRPAVAFPPHPVSRTRCSCRALYRSFSPSFFASAPSRVRSPIATSRCLSLAVVGPAFLSREK